ncbi:putative protein NRT1/ PTR FAMILY 2.13 [Iris pallida]|uniref:Uncharacterized protein n=1 Tax=Iris pallida TaxID=29817 RepID=A0AAX6GIX2_IRIPA|nr:putative protein NRT1/ PTR FAMILY 2.13 [Iris pallida]KAJ6828227.1 putative protein NRT1/ PTR FAMILY 2.13 [Iris pallida]KAJ6835494.1 putative protein NRT1/ PTR FAMILY 2.13 [Iris pallida]KAJ6835949.1 putative protein NRT1/ PTR FAMILY 2.13 [Iris pallida]
MTSKEEINHGDTTQVLPSPEDELNPEAEGTPKVVLSTTEGNLHDVLIAGKDEGCKIHGHWKTGTT